MNINKWTIDKYQIAYNWLWDNFGVTKGQICLFLFLILAVDYFYAAWPNFGFMEYLATFLLVPVFTFLNYLHNEQARGHYNSLNSHADTLKNSIVIQIAVLTMLLRYSIPLIAGFILLDPRRIIISGAAISSAYFFLVKVRDRITPDQSKNFSFSPT